MTSNSDIILSVKNLSKKFKLYRSPVDVLREFLGSNSLQELWALRDVSLEVKRGEVVGLLGANGAGKSTLLKIITGTVNKTSGQVHVDGRISAILELGSGVNPEYSGRENIVAGALCLGMSRKEISHKLDEIIEFSELREAIDRPFKSYSSGMQARLTFSTAIHVDPDILIVDEALSVGDAKFQLKCFDRIQEMRSNGCSILLVSHDTSAVASICDRAIFLAEGSVQADGLVNDVIPQYLSYLYAPDSIGVTEANSECDSSELVTQAIGNESTLYGKVASVQLTSPSDSSGQRLLYGEAATLTVKVKLEHPMDHVNVGFLIQTTKGVDLFGTNSDLLGEQYSERPHPKGVITYQFVFTVNIVHGPFFITVGVQGQPQGKNSKTVVIDSRVYAVSFEVQGVDDVYTTSLISVAPTLVQPCG